MITVYQNKNVNNSQTHSDVNTQRAKMLNFNLKISIYYPLNHLAM